MAATKLTARFCDSVRGTMGEQVAYRDAVVAGLEFRISGTGRKSWSLRYRNEAGRQSRVNLGTYPIVDLADARDAAIKSLAAIAIGKDPAAERRQSKARGRAEEIQTFGDLVGDYFKACEAGTWKPKGKKKREHTIKGERGAYRLHLEKPLGAVRLSDVSRPMIKRVLRAMAARGLGAMTNRTHALIRQAFAYALGEEVAPDVIKFNPAIGFPPLAVETPRSRVLTDDELKSLWLALKDPAGLKRPKRGGGTAEVKVSAPMRIAIRLCALLLQRKGEVIGMRLSELNLAQGLWLIPGERMKNGRPQMVPLPPAAVQLIREALALEAADNPTNDAPVFPNPRDGSRSMRPDSVSHAMAGLTAALGIKNATPHDLRRTGSSALTSERIGVSPFIRSLLLSHTSDGGGGAAVSRIHYDVNTYLPEKRRALEAWEQLLLVIVGDAEPSTNVTRLRQEAAQ